MDGKLEGDTTRIAYAFPDARRKRHVMSVARNEIVAGLSNADDGTATLQFQARQPVVEKALQIQRRHVWVLGVVPPDLAAQPTAYSFRFHGTLQLHSRSHEKCSLSWRRTA